MADASQIKEKIMSFIRISGPSLPVHIARHTGLSILFASAFLSELISDKELKTSHLHVGSSPLYLILGQEPLLENFSHYLKSREKDAFTALKDKKFLKDSELEPAIRIALREIKDFAVAFQENNEIYWRYFLVPEAEFSEKAEEVAEKEEAIEEKIIQETLAEEPAEKAAGKPEEKPARHKKPKSRKIRQDKKEGRNNFFNKVKEILTQKQIEILDIVEIGINKITFRVKKEEEYLIIAYNKKKIAEQDVIKSHKKSQELGLPYQILILGEPLKRFENLIEAVKNLKGIEKIE